MASVDLRQKFEGALIGAAVGDALGMPIEGLPIKEIRNRYGIVSNFLDGRLPKGSFTDDTEMMIAVAEALLEEGTNINHIARKLAEKHSFERGYGPGTLYILRQILRGKNWREISPKLFGSGSYGNGCIVRSTPLVLLLHKHRDTLRKYVHELCMITHAHKYALEAVEIFTNILLLAIDNCKDTNRYTDVAVKTCRSDIFLEKIKILKEILGRDLSEEEIVKRLGNSVEVFNTIPIALYAFLKNISSFKDSVIYAVNLGGDADSIAAIVGAWSGALHGSAKIPEKWRYQLENFEHIIKLANELYIIHGYVESMYEKVMKKLREKGRPDYVT